MRVAGSFCRTRWMPAESSRTNGSANRRPHLVLHLLQHVPGGDDEDPLAAAAADQLGEDHADLEGLAEPDGVGQQDPGPQVVRVERLAHGGLLVDQRIGQRLGRDGRAPGRRAAPPSCGRSTPATAAPCGSAGCRRRPPWPRRGPAARCRRGRRRSWPSCRAPARRGPARGQQPVGGLLGRLDQPLLVAHDHDRAGGDASRDVRRGHARPLCDFRAFDARSGMAPSSRSKWDQCPHSFPARRKGPVAERCGPGWHGGT